jgi:hypothetical protein
MKKIFTLAIALLGLAGVANAATVDDIAVCKHSYVMVADDYTNNGTGSRAKGTIFGDGFFLDVTGGSVNNGKGSVNLSVVDALGPDGTPLYVTQEIVDKYGEYGTHLNSLRLKNTQDMIAMRLTAKSKLIFFLQGNNKTGKEARYPRVSKNSDLSDAINPAPDENFTESTVSGFRLDVVIPDDGLYYIGSYNGDMFLSYVIVEAMEAPGTPTVKVGDQTFEGGLWFREVTCKANPATEEGSTEQIPTVVTYTTDGSTPTAESPVYTGPIKCYQDMSVKFQAFLDFGDGKPSADFICDGADNEGIVSFQFDAPTIEANGASFNITSPYAEQNGTNFYQLNGGEAVQGNGATLTESATVSAYTKIANGTYGTFTSKSTTKDVYVLNPIKEKKTIKVNAGDVVVDDEATASDPNGQTVYTIEGGAISADKMDFFVKGLTFGVVADPEYQIDGETRYIKMSNTNITFQVAEGDSVNVKVVCSKNSCKNLEADDAAEDKQVDGCTPDRSCYVNVSGTNYCHRDAEGKAQCDLKLYPDVANVIEFGLPAGTYTFQKYSGTGNILIYSIEIEPVSAAPAETETVLWEGEALVNGWGDQPVFLSDGGKELTENNAQAGDRLRIYCSAPDDNWQVEFMDGHWGGMYFRYAPKDQGPEEDGSPRAYEIVDISKGYFDFTITEEFMTKATAAQGWGGAFLLNGDGNLTVTKVTLVKSGASAIDAVPTEKVFNGVIYNLAGQKVDEFYKGVVIKNGKKVMQK